MSIPHICILLKRFSAMFIILAALAAGAVVIAYAETGGDETKPAENESSSLGITFPVPELGGCTSKDACRQYCNEPGNMPACISFAKSHGLMNEEDAARAEKFSKRLSGDGGPGGCTTPDSCRAFCENINNIEACIAFADIQGFRDEHVAEGKKVLAYIQSGGAMPGGCTSKDACETYCNDFAHAEECFAFAERAGITRIPDTPGRGEREGRFEGNVPPGQFQKLLALIKNGETPGGCTNKTECESYCRAPGHFEECIDFGTRVGFIEPEQAEKIRKTGGKGPGGCDSPDVCKAFCAEPNNQEECFRFGKEHGLINEDEVREAKEGFVRLRAGLENAPKEVSACLTSVLGPTIIEDIQSGTMTPGPEIGERVRGCFEKFGHRGDSKRIFEDAPKEVLSCVREKLGDAFEEIRSGKKEPTPEMADTLRVCFQAVHFEERGFDTNVGQRGDANRPDNMQGFLRSAPPGIAECLREKFGIDPSQLGQSVTPGPEMEEKMKACFENFRPQFIRGQTDEFHGDENRDMPRGFPSGSTERGPRAQFPPEVIRCLKENVNEDTMFRLMQGGKPPAEIEAIVGKCFSAMGQTSRDGERQGGVPNIDTRTDGVRSRICPAMPTVDSCPAGQEKVVVFSSSECGTYYGCKEALQNQQQTVPHTQYGELREGCFDTASCANVCTSATSPYFGSEQCVKFREYQSTQPTSGLPFGRLLGTVLVPFLQMFLR